MRLQSCGVRSSLELVLLGGMMPGFFESVVNWTMTLTGVVVCLVRATKQGSGLGLRFLGDGSDGPEPSKLPHGLGMDTQAKNPELASGIIDRRCGIKGKGPPNVLVRAYGPIVGTDVGAVYDLVVQEGLFFTARDALEPPSRKWCMLLISVPLAEPEDVLGSCWHMANGACFDGAGFAVLDSTLYPCF